MKKGHLEKGMQLARVTINEKDVSITGKSNWSLYQAFSLCPTHCLTRNPTSLHPSPPQPDSH